MVEWADAFRNQTKLSIHGGGPMGGSSRRLYPLLPGKTLSNPMMKSCTAFSDFTMTDTEQYYMHVDPGNEVPCHHNLQRRNMKGSIGLQAGVMPVVWKTGGMARDVYFYSFAGPHRERLSLFLKSLEITKTRFCCGQCRLNSLARRKGSTDE